jgi:hypothetical protein
MEPVSGETVVLPKEEADDRLAEKVIAASRKRWAIEYDEKDGRVSEDKKYVLPSDSVTDSEDGEPNIDGRGLLGADTPEI